jgi:hypothetical protein
LIHHRGTEKKRNSEIRVKRKIKIKSGTRSGDLKMRTLYCDTVVSICGRIFTDVTFAFMGVFCTYNGRVLGQEETAEEGRKGGGQESRNVGIRHPKARDLRRCLARIHILKQSGCLALLTWI